MSGLKALRAHAVGLAVAGAFLLALILSFDYGSKARTIPLVVSVVGLLAALASIPADRRRSRRVEPADDRDGRVPMDEIGPMERERRPKVVVGVLIVVAAVVGFLLLGVMVGMALFVTLYIWRVDRSRAWAAVTYGLGTVVFLYFLFDVLLRSPTYGGWLGSFLPAGVLP